MKSNYSADQLSIKILNHIKIRISRKARRENRKTRKELSINSLRSLHKDTLAVFAPSLKLLAQALRNTIFHKYHIIRFLKWLSSYDEDNLLVLY
jgi:hypothetical protein